MLALLEVSTPTTGTLEAGNLFLPPSLLLFVTASNAMRYWED